jgi:hypothetical protein
LFKNDQGWDPEHSSNTGVPYGRQNASGSGVEEVIMSCVLRVSGANFAVDEFLGNSTLQPYKVWRKGEQRKSISRPGIYEESGFCIDASKADFNDLKGQIRDVILFLKANYEELMKLKNDPTVEDINLDFGVDRKPVAAQSNCLPPELIRLAGELGMGIEISIYWVSDEDAGPEHACKRATEP